MKPLSSSKTPSIGSRRRPTSSFPGSLTWTVAIVICLLCAPISLAFSVHQEKSTTMMIRYGHDPASAFELRATSSPLTSTNDISRRAILSTATLTALSTALLPNQPALAASEVLNTMLSRLRSVPVFCIVNTQGIPYMVIKQQERMARGYAFTSMEAAVIVLDDAQKAAKAGGYSDIWADATIVTLPADIAVRLALQKRERTPTRGSTNLDSAIDIIPTGENKDDAMRIDKRGFQDQGKMPLFYVDGLQSTSSDGTLPLFMQRSRLISAWKEERPGEALPPIQVIDLTYIFEAALRGYEQKIPNGGKVSFVPDQEQVNIAKELRSNGLTMYKFDQMIV